MTEVMAVNSMYYVMGQDNRFIGYLDEETYERVAVALDMKGYTVITLDMENPIHTILRLTKKLKDSCFKVEPYERQEAFIDMISEQLDIIEALRQRGF